MKVNNLGVFNQRTRSRSSWPQDGVSWQISGFHMRERTVISFRICFEKIQKKNRNLPKLPRLVAKMIWSPVLSPWVSKNDDQAGTPEVGGQLTLFGPREADYARHITSAPPPSFWTRTLLYLGTFAIYLRAQDLSLPQFCKNLSLLETYHM